MTFEFEFYTNYCNALTVFQTLEFRHSVKITLKTCKVQLKIEFRKNKVWHIEKEFQKLVEM